MADKPTYMELEQKIKDLEQEVSRLTLAESELQASEKRYKLAIKGGRVGLWDWDLETNKIFLDPILKEMLGYRDDEISNLIEEWANFVHTDDRLSVMEAAQAHIDGMSDEYRVEHRMVHKDGCNRWILAVGKVERNVQGKAVRFTGTDTDITERKQIEEELLYKTALLEAQAEASIDGILVIDSKGKVVSFNKRMLEMWNIPLEIWETEDDDKLLQHAVTQLKYPDEFLKKVEHLYAHIHEKSRDEVALKDGRYFDRYSSPVVDSMNRHHGRIWYFRDVTDRRRAEEALKKAHDELERRVRERTAELTQTNDRLNQEIKERKKTERALREAEEHYRSLVENIELGITLIDSEYNILMANTAQGILFNKPAGEFVGKKCFREFEKRETVCSHCPGVRAMDTGQKAEIETEGIRDDGSRFCARIQAFPSFGEGGVVTGFIEVVEDITEKKKLETQIQQAHKMEAIGTLAGGIAHDFNNIMGIIVGNTELAFDDVPEWNPAYVNLEEIKTAGLRAKNVVRQLLSFIRQTDIKKVPLELVPVVEDALRLLRSTLPADIRIRQDIQATADVILADSTQLHQVIINLGTNAWQAMEETGGCLDVGLHNVVLNEEAASLLDPELMPGRYVEVSVNDTGPGIAPAIAERIFDPYFTTREVGEGSGLGLSVVLGIIKNAKGAIAVDSEIGKGTTFRIYLPIVEKDVIADVKKVEKLPEGTEKILFVDDEKPIVKTAEQMLARLGYQVETEVDPLKALALFRLKPDHFDLVITDMAMPQMTGDKLIKEIFKTRKEIPIILCSGYSKKLTEKVLQELGIKAFALKPLQKSDFAMMIRKVLDEEQ